MPGAFRYRRLPRGGISNSAKKSLAAIRKVLAGGRYISPRVAEQLATDLGSPVETELHALLSQKELQVLRLIASGESVKEIALRLYLSGKTVFTYRDRLRDKLGEGEIAVTLQANGESTLNETACPGVWWVTHHNEQGALTSQFIEVAFVPELVKAHPDDVAIGLEQLELLLSEL